MHKLFDDISLYGIEHGIDQKTVVEALEAYETPTTPKIVKEVWLTIQYAMYGTRSTTKLTTDQVDKVYEVFCKFWSELTGQHFPYPHLPKDDEE